jgi:hypothetical protein
MKTDTFKIPVIVLTTLAIGFLTEKMPLIYCNAVTLWL